MDIETKRLRQGDEADARTLFALMAAIFAEDSAEKNDSVADGYLGRLLRRDEFWAIAAFSGDRIVGGITAHVLPMTRTETPELFIFDIAVRSDYQRRGVGRRLVEELRREGAARGIHTTFVAADNEDVHALDFYVAMGGRPAPVTIFTFEAEEEG